MECFCLWIWVFPLLAWILAKHFCLERLIFEKARHFEFVLHFVKCNMVTVSLTKIDDTTDDTIDINILQTGNTIYCSWDTWLLAFVRPWLLTSLNLRSKICHWSIPTAIPMFSRSRNSTKLFFLIESSYTTSNLTSTNTIYLVPFFEIIIIIWMQTRKSLNLTFGPWKSPEVKKVLFEIYIWLPISLLQTQTLHLLPFSRKCGTTFWRLYKIVKFDFFKVKVMNFFT